VTLLPLLMLTGPGWCVTMGSISKVLACLDSLFFALALGLYYSEQEGNDSGLQKVRAYYDCDHVGSCYCPTLCFQVVGRRSWRQ